MYDLSGHCTRPRSAIRVFDPDVFDVGEFMRNWMEKGERCISACE